MPMPILCPNCQGTSLSWSAVAHGPSDVVDGRIRMSEVSVLFVLGCNVCSETIRIVDADSEEGIELLNSRKER